MTIYPIGDSHVKVLFEHEPEIFKNIEGLDIVNAAYQSKTAYAIGGTWYLHEKLENIPSGEIVVLSFGEIDCRHYVPRLAKEMGVSIENRVDEVIERYTTNCVRLLKDKFKVAIMGAYVCPDDRNHHTNSFNEIVEAKTIFNRKIKKYCEDNDILYIPLFEKGMEGRWHEDQEKYFSDSSHVNKTVIPIILEAINNFKW